MNDKSELLQQLTIDRSETSTTRSIKVWHLLLFGALCAGLAYVAGSRLQVPAAGTEPVATREEIAPAARAEPAPNPTPAPTVVPEDNTILSSSGYITARRMATVSAEIIGLIASVTVEEGMTVTQGQILAELDSSLAQVDLDLARARVSVLEATRDGIAANLEEARRTYRRVSTNEFSSDADKTGALSTRQNLSASLKAARANIRVATLEVQRQQERLADHTIRAPFGGVVTVKNAQPGEIVAPTSAGGGFTRTGICTIVDMQSLEIEVDVNEAFIGRVFAGQAVEARLDAYPDWVIPASVIAIIPTADRAKATVQVRIGIEAEDPRILPDMGVKVQFLKS